MRGLSVLDLFSAAAGGWSLGMHRAGFHTVAACEAVDWRRILYSENNPGVPVYDDVCTLTADRLVRDLGSLPTIVVGSPPCQDISSANTKGKGVEGERSGLFFEAIRIIGEVRPRWFALENSANLRTRGADAVLSALEGIGYACWPLVVRASDIGANNERPRSWLIGCDLAQVADANGNGWPERRSGRRLGLHVSVPAHPSDASEDGRGSRVPRGCAGADSGSEQPPRRDEIGPGHVCEHGIRWPWACDDCDRASPYSESERRDPRAGSADALGGEQPANFPAHPDSQGEHASPEHAEVAELRGLERDSEPGTAPDPDQAGQADGCLVPSLRQEEITDDGRCAGRGDDGSRLGQVGICEADRVDPDRGGSPWSLGNLASHVWLDARLQAWSFLAVLLDEGGMRWAGERLIAAVKSAASVERPSIDADTASALRTVLAFYSANTARRLAPIAETLSSACNITLARDVSWQKPAKSAAARTGLRSTTSTKTGPTTSAATSKLSASPAIPVTICEPDLWAAHLRAERRLKLFASRQVEAFGDAVVPQIPEAIGRAILRVEEALASVYSREAA